MHVFVLILLGRFSLRLYVSYSTFYVLGSILSMQIPFVGFQVVRSSEHMLALGVFGFIQMYAFIDRFTLKNHRQLIVILLLIIGLISAILLSSVGLISPWSDRFYSLWNSKYAEIHLPIISSVSEHQPALWSSFVFGKTFLNRIESNRIDFVFRSSRFDLSFSCWSFLLCSIMER